MKHSLLLILLAGSLTILTGCVSAPDPAPPLGEAASRNADHHASDIPQGRARYRGIGH